MKLRRGRGIFIFLILACLGGFMYYYWEHVQGTQNVQDQIEYIAQFVDEAGKLRDYSNKTGMKDPKTDIRLYMEDFGDVRIEFGNLVMEWSWSDFISAENRQALRKIGIIVQADKDTGEVLVFYEGIELKKVKR